MAENTAPQMQATLGLTGLTMNAMALIAPGAFLWLTFVAQATAGNTAPAMWIGILFAVLLCMAVCQNFEVHCRMGLSLVLLDLSRSDVRCHGRHLRLSRRDAMAELHERFESWSDVHDGLRGCDLIRGCIYRPPRRFGFDFGQHRD